MADRKILVSTDETVDKSVVFVCTEICNIDIMGDEDVQILIEIGKGMQKK